MTDPVFGLTITRDSTETVSVSGADMSVVCILGTAPSADATVFPYNVPVPMNSNDPVLFAALGQDGTIADGIDGINAQLADFQTSAQLVIIRCASAANDFLTIQNLIGAQQNETGMYAGLMSGELNGLIPRLWTVPGYTHQALNSLGSLIPGALGSGYVAAPVITVNGGGSDPNKVLPVVHAVLGSGPNAGQVFSYVIDNPGANITGPLTFTVAAPPAAANGQPANVTATVTGVIDQAGNAVCAALPSVLNSLLAHAVVEGPGTTEAAAEAWRETIDSQRLIPIDMWCKVQVADAIVARPGAPRVVGLGVARDFGNRGVPSKSWANQAVQGIVGFVRRVGFSLTDGSTEGQRSLLANIGIGVRGELGVESAIASSGFVFLGTDVATDDPLWQFYNVTRMRDYIHLGLMKIIRGYLGKFNLTGQTVQAILNSMDSFLRGLKADSDILGFIVGFEANKNSPENLRAGRLRVNFSAEEAPVLRRVDVDSRRYRPALDALVADIVAQAANINTSSSLQTAA